MADLRVGSLTFTCTGTITDHGLRERLAATIPDDGMRDPTFRDLGPLPSPWEWVADPKYGRCASLSIEVELTDGVMRVERLVSEDVLCSCTEGTTAYLGRLTGWAP